MRKTDREIIDRFEIHARAPDQVPHIMMKEQLEVLKLIHKEIKNLSEIIKQENLNHLDDGK